MYIYIYLFIYINIFNYMYVYMYVYRYMYIHNYTHNIHIFKHILLLKSSDLYLGTQCSVFKLFRFLRAGVHREAEGWAGIC